MTFRTFSLLCLTHGWFWWSLGALHASRSSSSITYSPVSIHTLALDRSQRARMHRTGPLFAGCIGRGWASDPFLNLTLLLLTRFTCSDIPRVRYTKFLPCKILHTHIPLFLPCPSCLRMRMKRTRVPKRIRKRKRQPKRMNKERPFHLRPAPAPHPQA